MLVQRSPLHSGSTLHLKYAAMNFTSFDFPKNHASNWGRQTLMYSVYIYRNQGKDCLITKGQNCNWNLGILVPGWELFSCIILLHKMLGKSCERCEGTGISLAPLTLDFTFASYLFVCLFVRLFCLSLVFRKSKQDLTENLMRHCNCFDPRPIHKNSKDCYQDYMLVPSRATVITWSCNKKDIIIACWIILNELLIL